MLFLDKLKYCSSVSDCHPLFELSHMMCFYNSQQKIVENQGLSKIPALSSILRLERDLIHPQGLQHCAVACDELAQETL